MANDVVIHVKAKDDASKTISAVEGNTKKMGVTAGRTAALIGVGLVAAVGKSVAAYRESYKVQQQTLAVLKSTGGAAGVTAKGVEKLATAISNKTGIDDEAIQSGENLLLTFTNIRNEVGKGNDIFDQATQTITDMSVALGQDMKTSAIQVGKALNDPVKGITALTRVGVTFSEKQKDLIKHLVKTGHVADAQKVILKELRKEFGGSAEAAATWGDKAKVAAGNVQEAFGKAMLPSLEKVSKWFSKKGAPALQEFADQVGKLDPDTIKETAIAVGLLAVSFKALGANTKLGGLLLGLTGLIEFTHQFHKQANKVGDDVFSWGMMFAHLKAKALDALDSIIGAWAKSPFAPQSVKKAAANIHALRVAADEELGKMQKKYHDTQREIQTHNIRAKIRADIKDLEGKVKAAKKRLRETNDQKTQAKIKAEIKDLEGKVRRSKALLHSIKPVNIPISAYISKGFDHAIAVARQRAGRGIPIRASGGNVGASAAGGGARGGQVLVGEQGPEIVDLPYGSHVNSNADSRRIGAGSGGSGHVTINIHAPNVTDRDGLRRMLVDMQRRGQLDVIRR